MSATPDGYTNLVIPLPPMFLVARFHKKQFTVNKLLCYLLNKLDGVPISVLVKITSAFYLVEVINAAKIVLFSLVMVPANRLKVLCRSK